MSYWLHTWVLAIGLLGGSLLCVCLLDTIVGIIALLWPLRLAQFNETHLSSMVHTGAIRRVIHPRFPLQVPRVFRSSSL